MKKINPKKAIFNIISQDEWQNFIESKEKLYFAPSLEKEGFIHNSTLEAVLPVANSVYKGKENVLLLMIDPKKLTSELKYEYPETKKEELKKYQFPHIYGPLNVDAVIEVVSLVKGSDGSFNLPQSLFE